MVILILASVCLWYGAMATLRQTQAAAIKSRWTALTSTSTGGKTDWAMVRTVALTTLTGFLFAVSTAPTHAQAPFMIHYKSESPSIPVVVVVVHLSAPSFAQRPAFANGLGQWTHSPGVWESTSPMMGPACGHSPGVVLHQTYQQSFMGRTAPILSLNGQRSQQTPGFAVQTRAPF